MAGFIPKATTARFGLSTILVLQDKTASEVAAEMIESGRQREPFYTLDFDAAYHYVKKFKSKMPRVEIFYAMKSNDDSMMVKLAIALGLGFDCASPGEINKILQHNIRPTSIIYAVPMKTPEQMIFARDSGVRHTTFDSPCELRRLKQFWPDAKLLIRLKLDSDSVYKLGEKFGCEFNEAVALLDDADRLDMTVSGVAFHVGSGCFSKQSYLDGLRLARALFDHESSHGRKMNILDIGGGFFYNGSDLFDQIADLINSGLEEWFPEPDIQIVAEPGRYLCEPVLTLYSNIRDIRTVSCANKKMNMVYLNRGHGAFKSVETWHIINKLKTTETIENNEIQDTILWGPTPDAKEFVGPLKMNGFTVQDWLVINQQGAYCSVMETKYCLLDQIYTRSVMSIELWNLVKDNPVFKSNNFVMDSGVAACLPSSLPPLLFDDEKNALIHNTTVIE